MSAEDELALPQVPEAQPEDPEDVSWALSTAEAMWARGDHLEGIKWVRKAAEAASDAENDERALQLAKAASELAALIARRSRASMGDAQALAGGAPPEPTAAPPKTPISNHPPSVAPTTSRMGNAPPIPPRDSGMPSAPPPPTAPVPSAPPVSPMVAAPAPQAAVSPSRPPPAMGRPIGVGPRSVPPGPIPLPSKAGGVAPRAPQAPQAPQAAAPTAPAATGPASGARAAPRPLVTNEAQKTAQPARGGLASRAAPAAPKSADRARTRRRSRENLDAEAKAAVGVADTAPQSAMDGVTAEHAAVGDDARDLGVAVEVPIQDGRVKRRAPEPEPTVVARREDLGIPAVPAREKSAEEWDASPTQNLTGDDMDQLNPGDRKTTAFALPPVSEPVIPISVARTPQATVHDPEIQTSQAVRVVVWRDGNGVHVAPAGTVVSSITIDAVLVVLEPSADLTAWLSQRER